MRAAINIMRQFTEAYLVLLFSSRSRDRHRKWHADEDKRGRLISKAEVSVDSLKILQMLPV